MKIFLRLPYHALNYFYVTEFESSVHCNTLASVFTLFGSMLYPPLSYQAVLKNSTCFKHVNTRNAVSLLVSSLGKEKLARLEWKSHLNGHNLLCNEWPLSSWRLVIVYTMRVFHALVGSRFHPLMLLFSFLFPPLLCPSEGSCSQPLWLCFPISSYGTFLPLRTAKSSGTFSSTASSRPFRL